MLRGNIDIISSNRISGWIYSDATPVTGKRVLAFSGEQCIGAGEIGLLRPDLRDAGLDDGLLGFEIMVNPGAIKNPGAVYVRLDCSDFSLFERTVYQRLSSSRQGNLYLYTPEEVERVEWMNRQGWLSHDQFTGLKAINSLGFYQRTFSRAELLQESLEQRASKIYAEVVSALFQHDIAIDKIELESATSYLPDTLNLDKHLEIVGVFGEHFDFEVIEGAHNSQVNLNTSSGSDLNITHSNSAHQVLLVHVNCLRSLTLKGQAQSFQIIRALR